MTITRIVIGVLACLIAWDVLTTYYGTLSIFTSRVSGGVWSRLGNADGVVHAVSIIFAIALITFVLSYRHIFQANNLITKGILIVAFLYDLATSIYGTASALQVSMSPTIPQVGIIVLLSLMATAAPLLINHVLEG